MEEDIKKITEENPLSFATINSEGKPYVIAVAFVKIKDDELIITNNYMKSTIENFSNSPNVSLVVWDKDWRGDNILGKAEYFDKGERMDFVKSIKENKGEPCKEAVVVEINKIKRCG